MDMIKFLSKCGLKFGVPGGNFFLYIYNFCQSKQESGGDEKDFEVKLVTLFDQLERSELLRMELPDVDYYGYVSEYLRRHQAAFRIQRWWRKIRRCNEKGFND